MQEEEKKCNQLECEDSIESEKNPDDVDQLENKSISKNSKSNYESLGNS